MSVTTEELSQMHTLWNDAREVSLVLHETWASLIRGKRLFMESAVTVGIQGVTAERLHRELVESAQREYAEAFKRMCELSDEYTTAKLKAEARAPIHPKSPD